MYHALAITDGRIMRIEDYAERDAALVSAGVWSNGGAG
jgi:hypothetical protein